MHEAGKANSVKLMQRPDAKQPDRQVFATAGGPAAEGRAADLETHLEQVQQITDSTLGFMSLEEVLSELLERVRTLLAADTAAILLLDEDRNVLVARAARGLEEEVRQGVQVPLARGFAGRVAAQGRPIVIEDLSHADVVNPLLRRKGIRSMLGVPLHVEGRVIGVMHVGTLVQRKFEDSDVTLLQLAADKAAMAIDVGRLTEQRAVTQIMQRTLLPDALPNVPGLRFSAKYLPAGSSVRLGGDWYDVFQLPDARFAFVIGDVVGRGVLAASVMSEIRTALRAYLFEGHELSRVMSLLNELLLSMGRNRGATAAILELDVEADELQAVAAGHLPPLVLSPAGEPSFLEQPEGLPLGFSSRVRYSSRRYGFPPGSALVLYTDGLVERRGESIDAGLQRLANAAAGAAGAEGMSLADGVYGALVDEATLDDDVALLVVESVPLGEKIELTLEAEAGVLAGLRRTVRRWLQNQDLSEDERFDVTVAVSEAAGNAIEHAYGAHAATFSVSCEREANGVRIAVRDGGRWRDSRPDGRGRGLAIIRALVDRVDITRGDEGTTVTLIKHTVVDNR
jgi:serine phosphatase RsbU (regulator of sigma subunit)/anti-sigma regulatory factor (Ser/Thr protein kinase)